MSNFEEKMCEKCEVKRINRTQKSFYRFTEILLVVLSWISFLFWATCSSPCDDIRKQVSLVCAILCRAFATIVTNISLKRKMFTYVSLFVDSLLFEVFRPQVRESLLLQDEPYLFGLLVYWQLVASYQVLTNGCVLQLLGEFEFTQHVVIRYVFNDMEIQSQRTIKCSSPPVALHNELVIDKFHFETMVTVWFICIILEHFYHTCADYIFWLYIKFEFVILFGRRQKQPCPYEQNQPHSENPPEQSTPVTRNGLEGNVIKNYKTGPSQRKVEKGFPHYLKKLRKRNLFRTGKLGWSQMQTLIPQNIAATENQGKCVTKPSINTQAALEIHVLLKETVVCSPTLERAPETFVIPKVSGVMSFTPEVALATPAPLKAPVVTSTTPEVALATPAPLKAPVVIATTPEVALATPAALKAPVVIATTPEVALATSAPLKAPVVIATTPKVALATPAPLKAPVVIATTPEVALATPAALKAPVVIATTPEVALATPAALKTPVVIATTPEVALATPAPIKAPVVIATTPEVALATPAALKTPVVIATTPEVALATPAPLKAPVVIATTPEVALAIPAALKTPVVIATTPEVALATPAALKAPVVIATTPEVALATPAPIKAPVVIATTPEVALATPAALKTPVVIATTPEVALATPAISKAALVMSKTSKVGNPTPSQDTHGILGISRAGLDSEQYEMTARPKGLCVIINNRDFSSPRLGRRDGTDEDVGKLNDFFTRSEFKVTLFENQTDSDILEELKRISSLDHRTYDCFVCFVLSHGQHESVYGTNGGLVSVSELQSFFSARQCRSLAKKPKMFFVQACQGEMVAQGVDAEDVDHGGPLECDVTPMYPVHELADFLTVFATAPGFIAYRNTTSGSPFIGTLIDTLRKYPGRNLLDIITMVTNVMDASVGQKQIPMMKSTLRKHVVLS